MAEVFARGFSECASGRENHFHDVCRSSGGKVQITVGQFAGTSPPIKTDAAMIREAIRTHSRRRGEGDLGDLFASMNHRLSQSGAAVNLFSCAYDARRPALQFVNAGWPTALLFDSSAGNHFVSLRAGGLGLGKFQIARYMEGLVHCGPDALLVLSSALWRTGEAALEAILERHHLDSLGRISEAIVRELFVCGGRSEAILVLARFGG